MLRQNAEQLDLFFNIQFLNGFADLNHSIYAQTLTPADNKRQAPVK